MTNFSTQLTRTTLLPAIIDVPLTPETEHLRPFIESVAENIAVMRGDSGRGYPLDKSVTFRDLAQSGLADVLVGDTIYNQGNLPRPGALDGEGVPAFSFDSSLTTVIPGSQQSSFMPPQVANFTAQGTFGAVIISWDWISDEATRIQVGYGEIWRSTENNLATAVRIGTTDHFIFNDLDVTGGTTYYYWGRLVSTSEVVGPYNAGAMGGTEATPTTNVVGTIDWSQIPDGTIVTRMIADLNITTPKLVDAAATLAKLADASVSTAKLAPLAVGTANIQDAAILSAKIGGLAVLESNIGNAAISSAKIRDAAILTAHIGDAVITDAKIANLAVRTAHIADAAITQAKMGNLAVGNAQIQDAAIDSVKIGTGAVTSSKLPAAVITSAHIGALQVEQQHITNYAIFNRMYGELIQVDHIQSDVRNVDVLWTGSTDISNHRQAYQFDLGEFTNVNNYDHVEFVMAVRRSGGNRYTKAFMLVSGMAVGSLTRPSNAQICAGVAGSNARSTAVMYCWKSTSGRFVYLQGQESDEDGIIYSVVGIREPLYVGPNALADSTGTLPPDAVDTIDATLETTSIHLMWEAPNDNGVAITGYGVEYKLSTDAVYTVLAHAGTDMEATIPNLIAGSEYDVRVRAISTNGNGEYGEESFTTRSTAAVSDAPQSLTLVPENMRLRASWLEPLDNGSAVTAYEVQFKKAADADWIDFAHDDLSTMTVMPGLDNGTAYDVRVRAVNGSGTGAYAEAEETPNAPTSILPGPVEELTITQSGANALTLNWNPPTSGGAATAYEVWYRQGTLGAAESAWTEATSTLTTAPYDVVGLDADTRYVVAVFARNAAGRGPSVKQPSGTGTSITVPSAPVSFSEMSIATRSDLAWAKPADGGSPITHYDLRHREDGGATWTTVDDIDTNTYRLEDLVADSNYEYEVRAANAKGDGAWSATQDFSTPTPTTTAGTVRNVAVTPADRALEVSYEAPGADSDDHISGYRIRYREQDDTDWTTDATVTGLYRRVEGLTNETAYQVEVTPTYEDVDIEFGLPNTANGTPGSTAVQEPDLNTPPNLEVVAGNTFIIVSFDRNSGGTHSSDVYIRGAKIEYKLASESDDAYVEYSSGDGDAYNFETITGLAENTTYDVRVSLSYRYPPGYALSFGDAVVRQATTQTLDEGVIAQYTFTATGWFSGDSDDQDENFGVVDVSDSYTVLPEGPEEDQSTLTTASAHPTTGFQPVAIFSRKRPTAGDDEYTLIFEISYEDYHDNVASDTPNTNASFASVEIVGGNRYIRSSATFWNTTSPSLGLSWRWDDLPGHVFESGTDYIIRLLRTPAPNILAVQEPLIINLGFNIIGRSVSVDDYTQNVNTTNDYKFSDSADRTTGAIINPWATAINADYFHFVYTKSAESQPYYPDQVVVGDILKIIYDHDTADPSAVDQEATFKITSVASVQGAGSSKIYTFGIELTSSVNGDGEALNEANGRTQIFLGSGKYAVFFNAPSNSVSAGLYDYRVRSRTSLSDPWTEHTTTLETGYFEVPGLVGESAFEVDITARSVNGYGTPTVLNQDDLKTVLSRMSDRTLNIIRSNIAGNNDTIRGHRINARGIEWTTIHRDSFDTISPVFRPDFWDLFQNTTRQGNPPDPNRLLAVTNPFAERIDQLPLPDFTNDTLNDFMTAGVTHFRVSRIDYNASQSRGVVYEVSTGTPYSARDGFIDPGSPNRFLTPYGLAWMPRYGLVGGLSEGQYYVVELIG